MARGWKATMAGVTMVGIAVSGAADARAQHGGHGAPHGSQGHRAAQSCADEFKQVVAEGRGFGMAFAADQHGYPGPMHVLELKDRLGLSAEQETHVHALYAAMKAELPKSERLLAAERKLERLFADAAATEASVRAAVAEIERARSDVRLVHLLAHLKTRDILTAEQRRIYHEARWR